MDVTGLAALKICYDARMAASITPKDVAAKCDSVQSEQMTKMGIAISQNILACKAELAPLNWRLSAFQMASPLTPAPCRTKPGTTLCNG